jgi:hypothetical protein
MTTKLDNTLPDARSERVRPTLPAGGWNAAQSLRRTFDGWGPHL